MSRHPLLVSTLLVLSACPGNSPGSDDGESASTHLTGSGIDLTTKNASTAGPDATTEDPTPTTSAESGSSTTGFNCGVQGITAKVRIPRVMLVLDKSGSMVAAGSGYWDADGDDADDDGFVDGDPNMALATPKVTRWNSLHAVVDTIVTNFEERMNFGAVLFPSVDATSKTNASACPVKPEPDVAVAENNGATILTTIPPADATDAIKGGTPAAAGIMTAVGGLPRMEMLAEEDDLRFIVLVTDGAANCAADAVDVATRFDEYDEQLPQFVADAHTAGISTFVVGIDIKNVASPITPDGNPDGINPYEKLNEVAELGGMPRDGAEKFYNTENQLELQAALDAIGDVIVDCTFALDPTLDKYQYVRELVVDPKGPAPLKYDVQEITDCGTESGWHFTDATRSAIQLCGDACSLYKASGDVNIVFDCLSP